MSLLEALAGKEIPGTIYTSLDIVTVPYLSFEKEKCEGQFVIHTELVEDVQKIFHSLFEMRFPIARIVPIVAYDWDDNLSMEDNNSSAFNYRFISGTNRLSNHAYGRALDINPMQNPYISPDGVGVPSGAQYNLNQPGTITSDIAKLFKSYGWEWGGEWKDRKDWQHFQKTSTNDEGI